MGRIFILITTAIIYTLCGFIKPAYAVELIGNISTPDFPTCSAPEGQLKVAYKDGIHGVPGDKATYTGEDVVYSIGDGNVTQCLCTKNGDGVQTDWWRISSLNFDEIEMLKKLGWIYIPTGSVWGLSDDPYLANNKTFDCGGGTDGKDSNKDDDDDNGSKRIGSVLGSSQGLPRTGVSDVWLYALFGSISLAGIYTVVVLSKENK